MVGSVLFGEDEAVAQFVLSLIPGADIGQAYDANNNRMFCALGVVRRGELVAGVIYHNCMMRRLTGQPYNIEVTMAATSADWAMPQTMRTLFYYPFGDLGVERMTARVARSNKRCRKLTKGLGFKEEGILEKAFDLGEKLDDLVIYGMRRSACKWLPRPAAGVT